MLCFPEIFPDLFHAPALGYAKRTPPVAMPAASMTGISFMGEVALPPIKPALNVPIFVKLMYFALLYAFSLVRMTSSATPFASAGPPHWQLVSSTVFAGVVLSADATNDPTGAFVRSPCSLSATRI